MNASKISATILLTAFALLLSTGCEDDSDSGPTVAGGRPDMGRELNTDPDMSPPDAEVPDEGSDAALVGDAGVTDFELADAAPIPDSGRPDICFDPGPMPSDSPFVLDARCRQPGGPLRIRDIRDQRCPDFMNLPDRQPGIDTTFNEAIVTGVYGDAFTVQDPEGGAYSGLWVFNRARVNTDGLVPGSIVRLSGQLIDFFTITELVLQSDDGLEILGQGPAPEPLVVADPARLADGGDLVEPMESLIVAVENVRVLNTAPDCPSEFGQFLVTGGMRVDDEAPFDYAPSQGDVLTRLVGAVHFNFGQQKILPRGDDDLEWVYCGGVPDKCETAECPVEPDAFETGQLIITEIQNNPSGDDQSREFVEIYNPSGNPLPVNGWRVQDCAGNTAPLSGSIPPRSFYVLAAEIQSDINGGVRAQADLGDLFLPNGDGSVLIFDAEDNLIDQVRYEPREPWPFRDAGRSLELVERAADNREGASWAEANERYGEGGFGTPGEAYRP
ncbi:MAG: lamin tail domain-containing protein [Bradymonadia bacterium]